MDAISAYVVSMSTLPQAFRLEGTMADFVAVDEEVCPLRLGTGLDADQERAGDRLNTTQLGKNEID